MKQSNPWQSYRQVATQTAPRGQLVLMLFDGALRFLAQALAGFTKKDPAEFNQTRRWPNSRRRWNSRCQPPPSRVP